MSQVRCGRVEREVCRIVNRRIYESREHRPLFEALNAQSFFSQRVSLLLFSPDAISLGHGYSQFGVWIWEIRLSKELVETSLLAAVYD